MFDTRQLLVLASGSPRRKRFFTELGLQFEVCPADVDESRISDEEPADYVRRIATAKARAISAEKPKTWVVAADTIVSLGLDLLGKPESKQEAVELLMQLSGKEHEVRTGFCLCNKSMNIVIVDVELTMVRFSRFGLDIARAYVSTGEPLDKAGAYGIQGRGGMLVETISGSYSNVVGLPLARIMTLLLEHNVVTVNRVAGFLS